MNDWRFFGIAASIVAALVAGAMVGALIAIATHVRNIDHALRRSNAVSVRLSAAQPLPAIRPSAESSDAGNGCGVERAAVKHLTDGFVLGTPVTRTIDQLIALPAPPVAQDMPRVRKWDTRPVAQGGWGPMPRSFMPEGRLVQLTAVSVVAAKQEADSDLHVIIQGDYSRAEMNVELPMAVCDRTSRYAARLAAARKNADAALGHVSATRYTSEDLRATIRGTLFYDVLHGQRGAANGVELHPVTMFNVIGAVK